MEWCDQEEEDSLPQETGRAKLSRYIMLLKVKCVCRLDQNTVTMALRRVFYSLSLSTTTQAEYCACYSYQYRIRFQSMLIFMLNERKSEKAAGASPQPPLGELTALPQTS